MTTEITSYNQLNSIINAQYDAIDGDLQKTAASSRLQAELQAQVDEHERSAPPPSSTPEERAEFFASRDATIAALKERISDLEATQDPSWIVDRVAEHLETVKQAKASYDAYIAARVADRAQGDVDDAPLEVGSLNLPNGFDISSLSATDLTALISALFETGARSSLQAAVHERHQVAVKEIREYTYEPIDTSTAAGSSFSEQLQALEWAPPELLSLAEYAASLGLNNSDLATESGLAGRLSGKSSEQLQTLFTSASASNDLAGYSAEQKTQLLNSAFVTVLNDADLTYKKDAPDLADAVSGAVNSLTEAVVQNLQVTIGLLSGQQPANQTSAEFVTNALVSFISANAGLWDDETGIDTAQLNGIAPRLPPVSEGTQTILNATLTDGQKALQALLNSGVDGQFRDSEFWNQVADELYVSTVASSLANDVTVVETNETLSEDHAVYDLTDPRAAQLLIQGLASLLEALEKADEKGDEKAGELLRELQTAEGQQKAREVFLILTQIITASAQTAEVIIENTTPSEEDQIIEQETRAEETRTEEAREGEALDVRRLDDELTSALALAAADYYFDSTTTDDSAQAVISGPGAGRDDIITVRLAQALIDANPEFFEALANDAGVANSELFQTLQSQADANTARDFTPSFI